MNILQRLYYFFSQYTDPTERRIGTFFRRVDERNNQHKLENSLRTLIQTDLGAVNLWTERRYKGYDYLTKKKRRELYENLEAIKRDFIKFSQSHPVDMTPVFGTLKRVGADTSVLRPVSEKLAYFVQIMEYLAPRNGRYVYHQSSSFGRLLRNPTRAVLEGDCNQIVTLYLVLYALKYDLADVQLTLYPGHVALHFYGVDIETTSGRFMLYKKEGQYRAPVHEIVSVNLLDTTDTNFSKSIVNPEVFLQAARLAYVVSSNRQIVKRNLEIAYRNTVDYFFKAGDYKKALSYARQSKDQELISMAGHNGAIQALKANDFSGARNYAAYSLKKQALLQAIDRAEAAFLFNAKQYESAVRMYERMGDTDMVRRSYEALYLQAQQQLKGVKTAADLKAQANTVRTMERYAKRSMNNKLIQHAASLTKHL